MDEIQRRVIDLQEQHRDTWRDRPESYWLARLLEEFGELGASLANDHEHPPEWELMQIAAICINWIDMRANNSANAQMLLNHISQQLRRKSEG
jgi:hypothetical protein